MFYDNYFHETVKTANIIFKNKFRMPAPKAQPCGPSHRIKHVSLLLGIQVKVSMKVCELELVVASSFVLTLIYPSRGGSVAAPLYLPYPLPLLFTLPPLTHFSPSLRRR